MRCSLTVPVLVLTCALASASPWEALVQRRRSQDPRVAKWALCVRQGEFSNVEAAKDPVFQKLLSSGDFTIEVLTSVTAQDLWSRKGWGREAHWLLLSPAGEEAGSGAARARGEEVLDRIHASGAQPRYEAREAFLREHPEQGEARLEAVNQAFQIVRMRLQALDRDGKVRIPAWHREPGQRPDLVSPRVSLPAGPQGEILADEVYRDVADQLEHLLSLPGWEWQAGAVASHLGYWDVGQSFRLRQLFTQASRDLGAALAKDPYDVDVANFWVEATDAAGLDLDQLTGLCVPVPGEPWPDPGLLGRFVEPSFRRKDWNGVLRLMTSLAPQGPPEPMTASGWESYCRLQCAIQGQRALALAGLGSGSEAKSALGEARYWGGSGGVRESLLARGSLFTGPGGDAAAWRQLLSEALGRGGEPPAMPALEPPLRLVLGGAPKWLPQWNALRGAAELAPWSPAELRWEVADRAAFEKRRAAHGWPAGPRWALYRGEELRASGQQCPSAQALAGMLEGDGPPMLLRLQAVLAANPEHRAAHRERFELLLRRMPDRRLEATLAQDAAQALVTLEFDPKAAWKPDPSLWAEAAQRALPALEQLIRTWPNRAYLWRAWVSWARFHPAQPSVLALAQSVAFWSPRWNWQAGLPYEVQREAAAEFRRQGNFNAMRDWFRAVWESLDHRPLRALHAGERSWVMERRREEETAVFQPLREALTALGCTAEQAELERVFGEMIGRQATRRP
jgi:hypothetical protein